MKKLFTLITAAIVSIAASAQVISFSETASAGELDGKTFANGKFSITVTDANSKMSIDANNAYFGTSADDKIQYKYRLKSAGKSSSSSMITVSVPEDGTLKIYARTGSNSATDRDIIVTQNGTALLDQILAESNAVKETYTDEAGEEKTRNIYPIYSAEVKAGEATITYPVGSINFYAFEFVSSAPSDGTWKKTGVAIPFSEWKGYIDDTYVGEVYTIEGDEAAKTIKITDRFGFSYTFKEGDNETIASINGQTFENKYDYFSDYFMYGDWYYANFTPNYDSYISTDEVTGYIILSGYFYSSTVSQKWGYLYITWDDVVVSSTKQIEWSAVGQVRKSNSAMSTYYTTDYIKAGDDTPAIISYNDGTYKVAAFAGVKGYDLNFKVQGDSLYVLNCDDMNAKGNLARVSTGLSGDENYGRLGVYFNNSSYDHNVISLNKDHGYINLRYGVGYTNMQQSKYPYISYALSWYSYPETVEATRKIYASAQDATGTYVDVPCPFECDSTCNIYYFSNDSTYVVPEYLGANTGDLEFKVIDGAGGYPEMQIVDIPLGNYYEGYDYFELTGTDDDYIYPITAYDAENQYYYSYFEGDIKSGNSFFQAWWTTAYYLTYNLSWGEDSTGIKSVKPANTSNDYRMYDLNGRVLNAAPAKGMYIQNGKKYMAK